MLKHDSALHWIITEKEVIETHSPYPQPKGVAWDVLQEDQLEDIPFLKRLKADLLAR
jgi:5-formyltetrahydrofolate cyclo-ligase